MTRGRVERYAEGHCVKVKVLNYPRLSEPNRRKQLSEICEVEKLQLRL